MAENIDVMDFYRKNYDGISREIVSAIREGFEEGVKEGVKEGFLEGLENSLGIGFLKIRKTEEKSLEKILEDVTADTIKNEVERGVKKGICPVLSERMNSLCTELLTKIKEKKITAPGEIAGLIRELNTGELAKTKIDEIMQEVKKYLPQNFVSVAMYDGFQKGMSECIVENVSKCDKKIKDALLHESSN